MLGMEGSKEDRRILCGQDIKRGLIPGTHFHNTRRIAMYTTLKTRDRDEIKYLPYHGSVLIDGGKRRRQVQEVDSLRRLRERRHAFAKLGR